MINVVLAFNMGQDIDGILNSSIGQPMATVSGITGLESIDFEPYQILLNSLGRKGMLATWSIVVAVQYVNSYVPYRITHHADSRAWQVHCGDELRKSEQTECPSAS